MKKTVMLPILLLALAMPAHAFNSYAPPDAYSQTDVLSYVAMPLAVSAVCDVRGVQTDEVGPLVATLNQAEVAPADFVDVFRYVPVALEFRTDRRADFVPWVQSEVQQGIVGPQLVTLMERRLRTYDTIIPTAFVRPHRRAYIEEANYSWDDDYVPVEVRHHCDRDLLDPLSLVDMPVAVSDVCDIGVPYDRVSSLVVELNLGDIPPVQFVEVMRYAPAALVIDTGAPDFVGYVHTERLAGITGYGLVRSIDRQLVSYDIRPEIDVVPTSYSTGYDPYVSVRNYVPPSSLTYVPQPVQTRVAMAAPQWNRNAPAFNGRQQAWNGAPAPALIAAPSQVQRLLNQPNQTAVVANPMQARRELARQSRIARETPVLGPANAAPNDAARGLAPQQQIARQQFAQRQQVAQRQEMERQQQMQQQQVVQRQQIAQQQRVQQRQASMNEHARGFQHNAQNPARAAFQAAPPQIAQPAAVAAHARNEQRRLERQPQAVAARPAPVQQQVVQRQQFQERRAVVQERPQPQQQRVMPPQAMARAAQPQAPPPQRPAFQRPAGPAPQAVAQPRQQQKNTPPGQERKRERGQ